MNAVRGHNVLHDSKLFGGAGKQSTLFSDGRTLIAVV